MKVVSIIGARPQFIKYAAISRAIVEIAEITEVVIHTGQHYDENMSSAFFEELDLRQPDYNLAVGSGTHGIQTGRMLAAIEEVILIEKPDVVVVYGDTNSTLAGALAAAKLHIPVAHVEAGMRSFNKHMPEEVNRVLTDHASDVLFAATKVATENLRREGILNPSVYQVGDVMYDAALFYGEKAQKWSRVLEVPRLSNKEYILATVHRAENTDESERLGTIVEALGNISVEMPVVMPLHPRTRCALERERILEKAASRLLLIEPVGYLDMLKLEKNARLIVTDSGGVQKEAFFYQVPCITLRQETEWVELVDLGWNRVVSPTDAGIVSEAIHCALDSVGLDGNPYGDGTAAKQIVEVLLNM